jgi:hypothetical protein
MSVFIRRIIIIILGLLAGLTAWPLLELILVYQTLFPGYFLFSLSQGAVFGMVLGAFLGSGEGLTSRNSGKIIRGSATGLLVGLCGGMIGFTAGQGLLFALLQRGGGSFALPLARGISWTLLGLTAGMVEGIRAKSLKKCGFGALGGILGGIAGGAAIELLGSRFPGLIFVRLAALLIFGFFVALFYALLERGFSVGVLRVLNGPLRGKEYSISQNRIHLGSDAKNDITATGYRKIMPRHGTFRLKGKDLFIKPAAEDARILVNEEALKGEQLLKYGDVLELGDVKLLFRTE